MKRALIRETPVLFHIADRLHDGPHSNLWGNYSGLRGNCSGLRGECTLWGECSSVLGDCTGVWGNCTGIRGDLDDCGITDDERMNGVYIEDLIM